MENENKEQMLVDYVLDCLQKGITHDEIKKQLHAVGWSDDEVDGAYAIGLTRFGVPVPDKNSDKVFSKKSTTVEIVINLFSFILLGILATALGILLFGIINHFFEDKLNTYYHSSSSATIHYAIASLIISLPLYYWTMRFWFKRFREDEGKIESRLTKWITYLVLLATAITIVGDLIVVIFNMLQGEITIRFFLKALTIFVITGGIFGFYFLERKKIQYRKVIPARIFILFGWVVLGIVGFSIVLGFIASGSPKTERKRTFDNTRESDLASLASCIGSYANEHKALPESLDDLKADSEYSYCANKKDPETGLAYEYNIINKSFQSGQIKKGEFELCADFSLDSKGDNKDGNSIYYMNNSKWGEHIAGKNCDKEVVVMDKGTVIYQGSEMDNL